MAINQHCCLHREKRLKELICIRIKMIIMGDKIKELLLRVMASPRFSLEKIWLKVSKNGKKGTQKCGMQNPKRKKVIATEKRKEALRLSQA